MDPLTQMLLGAAAAQAAFGRRLGRSAVALGLVGGELVDADVLLGPWTDPALPFELHRHFTHSLAFIPAGGALAAAPFLLFRPFRARAGLVYAATTVACATHGLLDNCTSYGTHLLWPFVRDRTAWDSMSIIDPVFTAVLALAVGLALVRGRARPAQVGLALAALYVAFGFAQHARAAGVQRAIAAERGHVVARGRVMPTLGNLVVWRSVYESDGRLWADAVRVPPGGAAQILTGASRPRFTADDLPDGGSDPERVRDVFGRFSAFATGLTAAVADDRGGVFVGDVRYSLPTGGFSPFWGLRIDPEDPVRPVRFGGLARDREAWLSALWRDVLGRTPGFRPVTGADPPRAPGER